MQDRSVVDADGVSDGGGEAVNKPLVRAKKLTKPQQRIVDSMRGGRVLMQQRVVDGFAYNWDGGNGVNRRPISTLLRRGILKPAEDAMFGADSQTVVLA